MVSGRASGRSDAGGGGDVSACAAGTATGTSANDHSRAQFGVFGAVVPLVLVCVMYIGFSASGTVLAGQAMVKLLNISHVAGMLIFSAIIIVIAVLGYKVIHKLGKLASIVGILAFVYMFITLLLSADLQCARAQ